MLKAVQGARYAAALTPWSDKEAVHRTSSKLDYGISRLSSPQRTDGPGNQGFGRVAMRRVPLERRNTLNLCYLDLVTQFTPGEQSVQASLHHLPVSFHDQ